jgi:hypothetical protein
VHNREVNQHIGVEKKAVEAAAKLGDKTTALALII